MEALKKSKMSYNQKIKSVNAKRLRGDLVKIAEITGYHNSTVSYVLSGKFRNDTIVNSAYEITSARKKKA